MSLSNIQFEFLKDTVKLLDYCVENGLKITFGETFRTPYQQAQYLREGKTKAHISQHQKRLAIDLNFFIDGQLTYDKEELQHIGNYWESLHPKNRWGGNFKSITDTPHFERLE